LGTVVQLYPGKAATQTAVPSQDVEDQVNEAVNQMVLSLHEQGVNVQGSDFRNDIEVIRFLLEGILQRASGAATDSVQILDALIQNLQICAA
jgi:hypothetical protein